uniref:Uncharacterized protein n=1 Tax=Arundo donax TaxID=35708 RepID=A0A0A8YM00_ARUDO
MPQWVSLLVVVCFCIIFCLWIFPKPLRAATLIPFRSIRIGLATLNQNLLQCLVQ